MLNRRRLRPVPASRGFTLIELMIALVASLVVVGSVLAFTVQSTRTSAQSIQYSRLTQDMRGAMALVSRELRRAGYNVNAIQQVGPGVTTAAYSALLLDDPDADGIGSCVMFGYDTLDLGGTADSTPGTLTTAEANEWRGFRRVVVNGRGVLEVRTGGTGVGAGCAGNHTWTAITDPAAIDVTAFELDFRQFAEAVAATVRDPADPTRNVRSLVTVRPVQVRIRAVSVAEPGAVRELRQWVRVRADATRLVAAP